MVCTTCGETTSRVYGVPKTEAERLAAHSNLYGTSNLPLRGTAKLTLADGGVPVPFVMLLFGVFIGGCLGYAIAKPSVTAAKIREVRAAYKG